MNQSELSLMASLNYEGRTVIEARSSRRYAWGSLSWKGLPQDEWGTLPDGREVWDVLVAGELTALQEAWIRIENTGVYGDMLWSGSMITAFVSSRFASAIQDAGFGGFELLPLEVRPKRGESVAGFSLLLPDNDNPDAPIRSFPYPYRTTVALDVSAEVIATLTSAGITDFRADDAVKRVTELLADD